MKKYTLLLLIPLILSACNKPNEVVNNNVEIVEEEPVVEEYIDDNPIKVGLYLNNKLITEYYTKKLTNHQDIVWLNVYYTNDEYIENATIKYNWNKYYNNYQNIENYKIGYYISFEVDNEKIEKTILTPNDKHSMNPYLYNYLYDDIHQADGAWYSHIEPEDMKDNTLFTSIKLYSAPHGSQISSPITLTVFTYDSEDDFDELGYYRGNSYHTVTIYQK